MTPEARAVAQAIRKAASLREASWDSKAKRYTRDQYECCYEANESLAMIINCLLAAGYWEIGDWCDEVLGPIGGPSK